MIISHRYQFIFLHCRKAAGSSTAVSLSRYLGPRDIQLSAVADCARHNVRVPVRMSAGALLRPDRGLLKSVRGGRRAYYEFVSRANKTRFATVFGPRPSQATASAVRRAVPDLWERYFTFCIVRNPWDKTVSDYLWRTRKLTEDDRPMFREWVKALETGDSLGSLIPENHSNWDTYTIDDRIAVDRVIKMEELLEGLGNVCERIGIPWDGWLPQAKARPVADAERESMVPRYRRFYSEVEREIVGRLYRKEIESFGYEF